jgi:serine/threonine protein kinase
MALEPAKLADFQLAGALGAGTTAKVYEAVHIATGRPVAIKVLEPSQAGGEMRERFAREAVLLSSVQSRFVGKILGFGFDRGQPFLVLERLTGETLDAKLRRDGPVPMPLAVRWVEQLLVGVRDCHDAHVIHRDIKPSNIFVHHDGFEEVVKLIDFGVARLREITGDTGGLTSTNHLIGSMGYMAPEQFRSAKAVGFPADLYAIGVVVFRTLTGRLPFVSRSLEAVIRMKAEQAPPALSTMPGMPKNVVLDWFVQKAMARDPSERFQTAREMLEHWWNVMASLDEDATTDVMRGIGRVDESYAGPLHRSRDGSREIGVEVAVDSIPIPISVRDPVYEDDHTIRKLPAMLAPPTDRTPKDDVPKTVRSPGDPMEDMPTRNDPNLRKLVERELELQRKGKGRG